MESATGAAPSKLILLGEHAVVYGHPALAVPLSSPSAHAGIALQAGKAQVELVDFDIVWTPFTDGMTAEVIRPFARLLRHFGSELPELPDRGWRLEVRSTIPIGCGLGSGASTAAAALSALCRANGIGLSPEESSRLVFEIEKIHHGTPSGVDNTVICLNTPVLFHKGSPPLQVARPKVPLHIVVADTGIRHKTIEVVSGVAARRAREPQVYDPLIAAIGETAAQGADAFSRGSAPELGKLMDKNQGLLEMIGVSSPELEKLIAAARGAGALGAKLSGAGMGGCMAALAPDPESAARIREALAKAGAALAFVCMMGEEERCARS